MRAIFCLRAKVNIHGHRIREFVYDPVRDLHVWQGRELESAEFNARSREVMLSNADLSPFVLLIAGEPRLVEPRVEYATPPEVTAELERLRAETKALRAALPTPRASKRTKETSARA